MAVAVVLCGVAFVCLSAGKTAPVDYYATKYDHIDVEAILNNRRMVSYYSNCLLSKGPCPPEGLEFKRILPEALQTNCARCTEKQRTVTLRAIKRLKKEYPKIWTQLQSQWDPEDVFVRKFETTFANKSPKIDATTVATLSNRFDDENVETSSTPPDTTTTTTKKTVLSLTERIGVTVGVETSTVSKVTPPRVSLAQGIGANIEATVALGTNIVGDFVRGIGALGTRVVATGAEIAGVVLKNFTKPL